MLYTLIFFCKQKTAYEMRISDWSSDVCSSDLGAGQKKTVTNADLLRESSKYAMVSMDEPVLPEFEQLRKDKKSKSKDKDRHRSRDKDKDKDKRGKGKSLRTKNTRHEDDSDSSENETVGKKGRRARQDRRHGEAIEESGREAGGGRGRKDGKNRE